MNDIYRKKTIEFGEYIADKDLTLLYGGGAAGLMGVLAKSVLNAGGKVIGVIPELIYPKVDHLPLTETIITEDMHSRKRIMYEKSDAFTALPGGIGTIEELSEIFTWQQLGYHTNPVSLYNINGFFDNFLSFLSHAHNEGFIKEIHRNRLISESDHKVLFSKLDEYDGKIIDKWS